MTESCRLSACNFTKNEFFYTYFSRILTAIFRTPIFQNISQIATSAEVYSGPRQTSKMKLFVNIINDLKPLAILTKTLHLMSHKVLCTSLLELQVLFIKCTSSKFIVTHLKSLQCIWCRFFTHKGNYARSAM